MWSGGRKGQGGLLKMPPLGRSSISISLFPAVEPSSRGGCLKCWNPAISKAKWNALPQDFLTSLFEGLFEKATPADGPMAFSRICRSFREYICPDNSLHGEVQFIEVYGVGLLGAGAVQLIVDGDAVPIGSRCGRFGAVNEGGPAVQGDGLEQQLVRSGALHLDDDVVPRAAGRVAGNAGGQPPSADIVPDVPLVAAGETALMPPDKALSTGELIDVKLDGLRHIGIGHPEVNIVGEGMELRGQSMIGVGQSL